MENFDFESNWNKIQESTGEINPVEVNNMEKTIFEQRWEEIQKKELLKKVELEQPASYADTSWGKSILEGVQNWKLVNQVSIVPETIVNLTTALFNAKLVYPKLKNAASGALKASVLRTFGPSMGINPEETENKIVLDKKKNQDIANYLRWEDELYAKFGTEEGVKKRIALEPEQAFNDLLMILVPGGKVAKEAGAVKVGSAIEKGASMLDPFNLAYQSIRTPLHGIMNIPGIGKVPESLIARGLKLERTLSAEARHRVHTLSMDQKTKIAFKEVEKLNLQANELNEILDDAISKVNSNLTLEIPKDIKDNTGIFKGLDEVEKKLLEKGYDNAHSVMLAVKKKTIEREGLLGRTNLNGEEAQKLKKGYNEQLSPAYQSLIKQTSATYIKSMYMKQMNKTVREYIEKIVPGVDVSTPKLSQVAIEKRFPGAKTLNAKEINRLEGDVIILRNAIEEETYKSVIGPMMSWQVGQKAATVGFGGAIAGSVVSGGSMTGARTGTYIGGAIGTVLGIIDSSPKIKSALANYLHGLKTVGITVHPNATLIRLGLYDMGDIAKDVVKRKRKSLIENPPEEIKINY